MAYCVDNSPAAGDHNEVHASQLNPLGCERLFSDGNTYIYLKGVTSLVAADACVFVAGAYTAIRATTTGPTRGQVVVAQAAVDAATKFGWFLIKGTMAAANIATHSSGSGVALALSSTAGRLTSTPASELMITGAWTTANSASNLGGIALNGSAAVMGDIST